MRTSFLRCQAFRGALAGLLGFGLIWGGGIAAQETATSRKSEREKVEQAALQEQQREAEIIARLSELLTEADTKGDLESRQLLIEEASAIWGPEHPRVCRLRGEIEMSGEWLTPEEVATRTVNNQRKYQYVSLRSTAADTAEGHAQLAQTAANLGLSEEARAHLVRLLDFDRENLEVRRQLGHVEVDGRWLTPEQQNEMQVELNRRNALFEKGREPVERIRRLLVTGRKTAREEAEALLKDLKDPDSALAVEVLLCSLKSPGCRLGVEKLSQWETEDATAALLRVAVFHTDSETRSLAREFLKERDTVTFLPDLLRLLESPVVSQFQLTDAGMGRVFYRHVFAQQKMDQDVVRQYDTGFAFDPNLMAEQGFSTEVVQRATRRSMQAGAERIQRLEQERRDYSRAVQQRNSRVMELLEELTGERPGSSPADWWRWWESRHDVRTSRRPSSYRTADFGVVRTEQLADYAPRLPRRSQRPGPQPTEGAPSVPSPLPVTRVPRLQSIWPIVGSSECFVAGTEVWTDAGLKPIETLTTGDRVLSRDLGTGRLLYCNVIQATQREAVPTFEITVQGETFRASGGHPFLVYGTGWMQAKDLQPDLPLMTRTGTALIESVTPAAALPLYNVVVEGESNYFVGKAGVLAHDNSIPAAPVRKADDSN